MIYLKVSASVMRDRSSDSNPRLPNKGKPLHPCTRLASLGIMEETIQGPPETPQTSQ